MELVPISIMASLVIGNTNNGVRAVSPNQLARSILQGSGERLTDIRCLASAVHPNHSLVQPILVRPGRQPSCRTLKTVIHFTRPPQARRDAPSRGEAADEKKPEALWGTLRIFSSRERSGRPFSAFGAYLLSC